MGQIIACCLVLLSLAITKLLIDGLSSGYANQHLGQDLLGDQTEFDLHLEIVMTVTVTLNLCEIAITLL